MRGVLYGVDRIYDAPRSAVMLTLSAVALLATAVPVLRIARIDPASTLRRTMVTRAGRNRPTLSTSVTGRPRTLLLGLIGAGIDASRSPAMHEEEALPTGCAASTSASISTASA